MRYNLTAIRKLIIEAFDDEELTVFCHDHFGQVIERFSASMSLGTKAFHLATYCDRHEQLGLLVDRIKAERPEKYRKYQAQLDGSEQLSSVVSEADAPDSPDVYSAYEAGLHQLLHRLGQDHPLHLEALVYQQRLFENIAQSRRHGDTDTRKAERSEIIGQLNQIALSTLGVSFSELCGLI
jgi:hypothetical protein